MGTGGGQEVPTAPCAVGTPLRWGQAGDALIESPQHLASPPLVPRRPCAVACRDRQGSGRWVHARASRHTCAVWGLAGSGHRGREAFVSGRAERRTLDTDVTRLLRHNDYTVYATGDSACRRVDRVVWPKLLRPVRLRSHRSRSPRRSDELYFIYDIRWLSIAGGRALARGGGVRAVTTYLKC